MFEQATWAGRPVSSNPHWGDTDLNAHGSPLIIESLFSNDFWKSGWLMRWFGVVFGARACPCLLGGPRPRLWTLGPLYIKDSQQLSLAHADPHTTHPIKAYSVFDTFMQAACGSRRFSPAGFMWLQSCRATHVHDSSSIPSADRLIKDLKVWP